MPRHQKKKNNELELELSHPYKKPGKVKETSSAAASSSSATNAFLSSKELLRLLEEMKKQDIERVQAGQKRDRLQRELDENVSKLDNRFGALLWRFSMKRYLEQCITQIETMIMKYQNIYNIFVKNELVKAALKELSQDNIRKFSGDQNQLLLHIIKIRSKMDSLIGKLSSDIPKDYQGVYTLYPDRYKFPYFQQIKALKAHELIGGSKKKNTKGSKKNTSFKKKICTRKNRLN